MEIARAVEAGYYQTCRFNPDAEKKFTLDSKPPKGDCQAFIKGENRLRQFPDVAPELFAEAQKDAEQRLAPYRRLAQD